MKLFSWNARITLLKITASSFSQMVTKLIFQLIKLDSIFNFRWVSKYLYSHPVTTLKEILSPNTIVLHNGTSKLKSTYERLYWYPSYPKLEVDPEIGTNMSGKWCPKTILKKQYLREPYLILMLCLHVKEIWKNIKYYMSKLTEREAQGEQGEERDEVC